MLTQEWSWVGAMVILAIAAPVLYSTADSHGTIVRAPTSHACCCLCGGV